MPEPEYEHETHVITPWEGLLEEWQFLGKITEEEYETMTTLVVDEIWGRERKGFAFGQAWRGRQQHGG